VIFKVIGDVHPGTHFLGYVKYYPDARGDRVLFGRTYRQNSVVSKAFGILADRPECYIYSPAVGCVITGVPREDIVTHYSCRQTLTALHQTPGLLDATAVSEDLLASAEPAAAGPRINEVRRRRVTPYRPAGPASPARAAVAASSRGQPSTSTDRRSPGCHPQADAASSRARTAPGSCRFREPPRTYPTSPEPRGNPPGTYRPLPSAKTMRSGPPAPAGCGYSVRVSRQCADRPLPSTQWLWRSVHRYTHPSATSRRGFFGWRGTEPRVRGLIHKAPRAAIELR
jgi:hypothetical protein